MLQWTTSEGSQVLQLCDLQPVSQSTTRCLHGQASAPLGSWWGGNQGSDTAYQVQVGPSSVFWTVRTGLTVMAGQEAG